MPTIKDVTISARIDYLGNSVSRLQKKIDSCVTFWDRVLLNADAQYVAERYVSNPRYPTATPGKVGYYNLLNSKLTFRLTPKQAKVQSHLYVAGETLTDKQYEYLPGYPASGITIMGGANLAF